MGDPESGPDVVGDPGDDAGGSADGVGVPGGDGDGAGEGDGGGGGGDGEGVHPPGTLQVTGIVSAPGQISMNAEPPPADRTATASPARWPRPSVPPCLLSLTCADELRADQVTGPCGAAMTIVPADR